MRKINFIQKLVDEEKIKLVEESSEVAESYNQKSRNSLKASKILLSQELLEEAVSMSYYAMYHKALSLLYLVGIKCENHAATIILLKELFGIDNSKISFAKKERVDKQYYTDFKVIEDDVKDGIAKAEQFIAELDLFIDKLTSGQIRKYKDEFEERYFSSTAPCRR